MLLDWFTVGAQVLNFLLLVWLLQRFLYRPLLRAIDAREKQIAATLADAAAKEAAAEGERREFQRRHEEFAQQRVALLAQATAEAKAERQRLLAEARAAAEALAAQWHEALLVEARELDRAIAERTRQEVFALTRQALAELAGASLEERLGEVFVQRLRQLDGEAGATLRQALQAAAGPALLRSAFAWPEARRAVLRQALRDFSGVEVQLVFETAPALIGGLELVANGQKLAWSLADYLASLERDVAALLDERLCPGSSPAAAPLSPSPNAELPPP